MQAVPDGRRQHQLQHAPGRNEARDAIGDQAIGADAAAQQGAPRKTHRDEVGTGDEHRWERFGAREHESRVREAALPGRSSGATRRLGHRRRVGVDAQHEGPGLPGRRGEDRAAVTGAHVNRHPREAGDEIGDLADVHLEDPTSHDEASHGRQDSLSPPMRPRRTGPQTACTR